MTKSVNTPTTGSKPTGLSKSRTLPSTPLGKNKYAKAVRYRLLSIKRETGVDLTNLILPANCPRSLHDHVPTLPASFYTEAARLAAATGKDHKTYQLLVRNSVKKRTGNADSMATADDFRDALETSIAQVASRTGHKTGHKEGFDEGHAAGHAAGHATGHAEGHAAGHAGGYQAGHQAGHAEGRAMRRAEDYLRGYERGYIVGEEVGLETMDNFYQKQIVGKGPNDGF